MSIKEKLKLLLKEADLYKSQGLLTESREKYFLAAELIRKNDRIQNRQPILDAISKKIASLDAALNRWEQASIYSEVPAKTQELIKKLFTDTSADKNESEKNESEKRLKQTITLAKFGQYKRALKEFETLVHDKTVGVKAAKNALKCTVELDDTDYAVQLFHSWEKSDVFNTGQMELVKTFLQNLFQSRGIDIQLGTDEEIEVGFLDIPFEEDPSEVSNDIIDITSIGIKLETGTSKEKTIELDVSFQAGNVLSLIISSSNQELIEKLKVGVKLDDMDFYSPIAIFKGSGVVEANTRITSGPKRGDYSLDIKISSL